MLGILKHNKSHKNIAGALLAFLILITIPISVHALSFIETPPAESNSAQALARTSDSLDISTWLRSLAKSTTERTDTILQRLFGSDASNITPIVKIKIQEAALNPVKTPEFAQEQQVITRVRDVLKKPVNSWQPQQQVKGQVVIKQPQIIKQVETYKETVREVIPLNTIKSLVDRQVQDALGDSYKESLRSELLGVIHSRPSAPQVSNYGALSLSQRIDNLSGATISNSTISGGTLTGGSIVNSIISGGSITGATADLPALTLSGTLNDINGDPGTAGHVLSSTGTGVDWVPLSTVAMGSIDQHSDVDTSTTPPANGEVLSWDGANWVPTVNQADNLYTASGTLTADRNIAFNTNNLSFDTDKLFINGTTGNIGIGATSPAYKLDVNGTGRFGGAVILDSTLGVAGNTTIAGMLGVTGATTLSDDLTVDTNTLYVDSTNNRVGIGTTTPSSKLEVIGDIKATTFNSQNLSNGGQGGSLVVGTNATVAGYNSVAIGNGASATSTNGGGVAVGRGATADYAAVAIGNAASTSGSAGVSIGNSASTSGASVAIGPSAIGSTYGVAAGSNAKARAYAVAIGYGADAYTNVSTSGVALGRGALLTGSRQFVVGGNGSSLGITGIYFGSGVTDATPQSATIYGTSGSGTDVAGADLSFAAGRGTGAGGGGNLIFKTSPTIASGSTLGTLYERMRIDNTGNIGIGATAPTQKLHVSGGVRIEGALYDSGNSPGTSGQLLTSTATGTSWAAPSTALSEVLSIDDLTDAISNNTTNNLILGHSAASIGTSDTYNTALGLGTLISLNNSGAGFNTAVGYNSLNANTSGDNNTAVGYQTLFNNTTGYNNSAVGRAALRSNTTGFFNTAQGVDALSSNLSGNSNTAVGIYSLTSNTSGSNNVALGRDSLYFNTSGVGNTAVGVSALRSNTGGGINTAVGLNALRSNTIGGYNIATGAEALYANTTGTHNIAQGYRAGRYIADGSTANTTGDYNVFLGANTKALADNDQNEIVIGYNATGIGSNSVVLGNDSITTTALKGNVGIGTTAPSVKLHLIGDALVEDSSYSAVLGLKNNTGKYWSVESNSEASFQDSFVIRENASGNHRFRISPGGNTYISGNVGIGTTTPVQELDVAGDIKFSGSLFAGGAGTHYIKHDGGTASTDKFTFRFSDNEDVLTVAGNGRVGIGTTTPGAKLQVAGDSIFGVVGTTSGVGSVTLRADSGAAYAEVFDINFQRSNYDPTGTAASIGFARGGNIADGQILFKTNLGSGNTERMRITTAGNVGIGTAVPGAKLEVTGTETIGGLFVSTKSNGNTNALQGEAVTPNTGDNRAIYAYAANSGAGGAYSFYGVGGTLYNAGNVGIGTAAPASKLDVREDGLSAGSKRIQMHTNVSSISNFLSTDPVLYINNADAGDAGIHLRANTADYSIRLKNTGELLFEDDNTERLRIDAVGNLGLGTSAPAYKLDIAGTGRFTDILRLERAATKGSMLNLLDGTEAFAFIGSADDGLGNSALSINAGGTADTMYLRTNGVTALTIDSARNVGIGTTSPATKLQVTGNGTGLGGAVITIDENNVRRWYLGVGYNTSGVFSIVNGSTGTAAFNIDANSNIGIGTVTPRQKLDVSGAIVTGIGHIVSGDSGGHLVLDAGATGNIYFRNSGSVDGDALIAPYLDRMIITGTGRVGIGTTAPADVLDVQGDIRVGTGTTGCVKDADGTVIAGTCSSDENLKTDIEDIDEVLDKFKDLRIVNYKWNQLAYDEYKYGTEANQIGALAQNVETIFPELVITDSKGYKQVNYTGLQLYAFEAIRELAHKVDDYTSQLANIREWLANSANGIQELFAGKIYTEELCVGNTCVNEQQLAALLAGTTPTGGGSGDSSADSGSDEPYTPTITILGNNPAQVATGETYNDLGATAKGPDNQDLSITTYLNDQEVTSVEVDTSVPGTHIVKYTVSWDGVTTIATREVIVGDGSQTTSNGGDAGDGDQGDTGGAGGDGDNGGGADQGGDGGDAPAEGPGDNPADNPGDSGSGQGTQGDAGGAGDSGGAGDDAGGAGSGQGAAGE